MASLIHLDTHCVVWLAAGELDRFEAFVPTLLLQSNCAISPMVRLELDYLHEIGRVRVPATDILEDLTHKIGLKMDDTPFADVVARGSLLTWTRDPFDRLICASALAAGTSLLTKDDSILANESCAFWNQPPP